MKTKTKIIATIGPASNNKGILKKMIQAGVNVVRLNFSHGTYEQHGDVINMIRSLSRELNQPVGILLDLQGPKVRTGKLKKGEAVSLEKNAIIKITSQKVSGSSEIVGTTYKNLPNDVQAGDKIIGQVLIGCSDNFTAAAHLLRGNFDNGVFFEGNRFSFF